MFQVDWAKLTPDERQSYAVTLQELSAVLAMLNDAETQPTQPTHMQAQLATPQLADPSAQVADPSSATPMLPVAAEQHAAADRLASFAGVWGGAEPQIAVSAAVSAQAPAPTQLEFAAGVIFTEGAGTEVLRGSQVFTQSLPEHGSRVSAQSQPEFAAGAVWTAVGSAAMDSGTHADVAVDSGVAAVQIMQAGPKLAEWVTDAGGSQVGSCYLSVFFKCEGRAQEAHCTCDNSDRRI